MPSKTCLEPMCPEAAHYRGYCRTHANMNDRQINRAGRHIYFTAKWRHTRERVLFEQPLCATPDCGRIATDVHHIVDLADGGEPWARENLEGLCATCHGKLTRAA